MSFNEHAEIVLNLLVIHVVGVGGQIDFIRGAAMGLDGMGKPILALPSKTKKGVSKIVPYIKQGKTLVS